MALSLGKPWRGNMVVRDHTPFEDLTEEAVWEWDSRLSKISMAYQDRESGQCEWKDGAIVVCYGGLDPWEPEVWGRCNWRFTKRDWTIAARVAIYETTPADLRFEIVRHELGHALRLGHSQDRTDVMFPYVFARAEQTFSDATCLALGRLGYGPQCENPEEA